MSEIQWDEASKKFPRIAAIDHLISNGSSNDVVICTFCIVVILLIFVYHAHGSHELMYIGIRLKSYCPHLLLQGICKNVQQTNIWTEDLLNNEDQRKYCMQWNNRVQNLWILILNRLQSNKKNKKKTTTRTTTDWFYFFFICSHLNLSGRRQRAYTKVKEFVYQIGRRWHEKAINLISREQN